MATKGLELTATKAGGIIAIRLLAPGAGSIDGIKVGDIARDVMLKWGAPLGGMERVAQYGTDNWIVIVHLADKGSPTIVEMTLADKHARPVQPDSGQAQHL